MPNNAETTSRLQGHIGIKSLLIALLMGLLVSGCMVSGPENELQIPAASGDEITLSLNMGMKGVNSLSKSNVITLNKLYIVMISNATPADTVRDSVDSPALNTVSTASQVVSKAYNLKALRTWKIYATVRDTRDSIIHRDSADIPLLLAGSIVNANLNMSSRFVMYEARFSALPDSISSSVAGGKQKLLINRLVLKIGGVIVRDSSVSPGYFASAATHSLAYDYVGIGSKTVELLAYGPMGSWNVANPLYQGSTTVNVSAGQDSTVNMALSWVGPTTGAGTINATLGKVGKVTIIGTLPGTVIP